MTPGASSQSVWTWKVVGAIALVGIVGLLVAQTAQIVSFAANMANRSPSEVIRYVMKRLEGHNRLEAVFLPPIHLVQAQIEHPVPAGKLPTLGKGVQVFPLPPQLHSAAGQPLVLGSAKPSNGSAHPSPNKTASTPQEIVRAVETAKEGDAIEILPGIYPIRQNIRTNFAGTQAKPIRVFASVPGQVIIEFSAVEGFHITQPFWVFENLRIRGVCKRHDDCEHAFHVVGKAQSTVIRNNLIEDFNAHLKINGFGNHWPDAGLAQFNTLTNTGPRQTTKPVTPIDIVGASDWSLYDNLISNFIKDDGNKVAFGAFMKGAGQGGVMSRNLVICTHSKISQPGVRVGLSFGGGGTQKSSCRDKKCSFEHKNGRMTNNIVAHCNDDGIDINNSVGSHIFNNTLINTAGISMRHPFSSSRISANLLSGNIRNRSGGIMQMDANEKLTSNHFSDADRLALAWRTAPKGTRELLVPEDFCGTIRGAISVPGALSADPLCFGTRQ